MAMHMNRAAVDSMKTLQVKVTAELVKRFEAAGLDPKLVDEWTDQMIANSFEFEGPSGPDVPVYRVTGPRQVGEITVHEARWMVRRLQETHAATDAFDPRAETLGHALSLWTEVLAHVEAGAVLSERPTGKLHTI